MSIKPIRNPLDGERVVALSPETANEAATDWLRRPNLFPGRALTAPTLEQRQRWQASRIVVRSQAFTRGVARGLEVGYTVEAGPRARRTSSGCRSRRAGRSRRAARTSSCRRRSKSG